MTPKHAACLLLALSLGLIVRGQPATSQPAESTVQIGATGHESELYIALIRQNRTQLFERSATSNFTPQVALNGPIEQFACTRDALYAFSGGELYALRQSRWIPELNLPDRARPIDLLGIGADLYAIVPSPPIGKMQRLESEKPTAATRPFDAGDAPLSVVRYGARGWTGVAPLPPNVTPGGTPQLGPRLGIVDGEVRLFWLDASAEQINAATLDSELGTWSRPKTFALERPSEGFWFASIGGAASMIVAMRGESGPELAAFRIVPDKGGETRWRPVSLQLSALPGGGSAKLYDTAFAFNQHVALLALDPNDDAVLQFGRLDAAPAEPSVFVRDVFQRQNQELFTVHWIQTLTVALLFAAVLGLFVFRRGALVQTLVLPRGTEIAFTFQRLSGAAIDLAPFAILAGYIMGVDWQSGLRQLVDWAIGLDPNRLPALGTLAWWASATGASAIYSMLFELVTRRTLGKLIVGTRILAETAVGPSPQQIVIRNLLRFIELQPPMWVLGFLVLLSRNRQRLGDIFARTVVVRRTHVPAEPPPPGV